MKNENYFLQLLNIPNSNYHIRKKGFVFDFKVY